MLVSIVIPTLNEGDNLRKTIVSLQAATDANYEIIVVDNGSNDGSSDFIGKDLNDSRLKLFKTERLGVANSRNYGAQQAQGEFLFFVDAHVLLTKNWLDPMLEVLRREETGIVAPAVSNWDQTTTKGYGFKWRNPRLDMVWLSKKRPEPYPVPMAAGLFQGFRTELFWRVGGYDPGMITFGSEDAEICLRSWILGYQVYVVPQAEVSHLFRRKHPYKVHWEEVVYNMLRIVVAHFNQQRMERSISAIKSFPAFNRANLSLQQSDIWQRRKQITETRIHDDEWFFKQFDMNF